MSCSSSYTEAEGEVTMDYTQTGEDDMYLCELWPERQDLPLISLTHTLPQVLRYRVWLQTMG